MAEAIVGLVLQNLVPLLLQEATFLRGIHKEVGDIKDELESIQSLLKDADERAEREVTSDGVKTWVRQLREAAYQLEDVIDKYVLHMALQSERPHYQNFGGFLRRALSCIVAVKPRSEIAGEIQQIKTNIREIKERGETYGLINSSETGSSRSTRSDLWHDPRIASLFIEEAEVVGIERHRDVILDWLVRGPSTRIVVSVVGMGGLGKTTLVRKVFDHPTTESHFYFQAWVTVSQSYKEDELLRTTLKQFYRGRKESPPAEIDKMDETMLIEGLRNYLAQKSFIVVFDDVWHVNFWTLIKYVVPDNNQGSRVLITTRKEDVASICRESSNDQIYKLQPLPEDKAFELFCKKVFHSDDENGCPPELKELSQNVVRRCQGLPLAIVAIGGMLSTKRKTLDEWQKLERTLGYEMVTNPHLSSVTNILSLSYYDLPYYLKLCFMYFGMLPEDYTIYIGRLTRLWIAEGFVKATRGKSVEQVAEEYLTELISRSLVQAARVDIDGKVRFLKVHDLLRDIILMKSEEWSYSQVWEDEHPSFEGKARRLSIIRSKTNKVIKNISNFGVRSVTLFEVDKISLSFLSTLASASKLLKVLDLYEAPMDFLPNEVCNLFHLRYLNLRFTKVKVLPRSIGKLYNLQTLDLKFSLVYELPIEIKQLRKLRYLIGYYYDYDTDFSMSAQRGFKLEDGGHCFLEDLQKLYLIEANHGHGLIRELKKLLQLKKLGINKLPRESGKILCESIASLSQLESLEVCSTSEDEMLDLQFVSSPPQGLRRIYLKGRLDKIPDWIIDLKNLTVLSLMWSRMKINLLEVLQNLPYLIELVLHEAYLGEELTFSANGFQKLKILKLYDMHNLSKLTIEDGALPKLKLIKLGPLPRLKIFPPGIRSLRNLLVIRVYDMPKEFAFRVLPDEGPDFYIVQHVRTLLFHYQTRGERYKSYTASDLKSLDDNKLQLI